MTVKQDKPGPGVDWEAVNERLARTAEYLRASERISSEQADQILAARARRLAEVPEQPPEPAEILTLLEFRRGEGRFAIEAGYVHEISRSRDITLVPDVPEFVVGVTNLHGEILAIVDLVGFFGRGTLDSEDQAHLIVLGLEQAEFGILADSVDELTTYRKTEILGVPAFVPNEGRGYLKGATSNAVLVIDGSALLKNAGLFVDQED